MSSTQNILLSPQTARHTASMPSSPPRAEVGILDNDNSDPTPARSESPNLPLTLSDYRTLSKLLANGEDSSSSSAPDTSKEDLSLLNGGVSAVDTSSSSRSGNEDEVSYFEEQLNYDDEAEDGYEDEDVSMELSDIEEAERERNEKCTSMDAVDLLGTMISSIRAEDASTFELYDSEYGREGAAASTDNVCDDSTIADDGAGDEMDDSENSIFQALQDEIGMRAVDHDIERFDELESFEGHGDSSPSGVQSKFIARRASDDTPQLSSSLIAFPDVQPSLPQTPNGKRVAFAPSTTIPDTPFTSTIKYFQQFNKGKENSPTKGRRNASSPDEIAQLVQAAQDDEGLDDLNKDREADLAPMKLVMESDSADDLITFGTPVKRSQVLESRARLSLDTALQRSPVEFKKILIEHAHAIPQERMPEINVEASKTIERPSEQVTIESAPPHMIDQAKNNDKAAEESAFVANPSHGKLIVFQEDPTFVKVIGMLPETFFWVAIASVVQYTHKVLDALVEKLAGLEI